MAFVRDRKKIFHLRNFNVETAFGLRLFVDFDGSGDERWIVPGFDGLGAGESAAGDFYVGAGPPEHDGPVGDHEAAAGREWRRESSQPRQLRRVSGQSLSKPA